MIKYVLFDLDGTLTDPSVGITNSVKYALNKFGINVENTHELYPFIGPPLYDSFVGIYGFSHDNANLAVKYYREYFSPYGLYENALYDGIEKMLENLNAFGYKLILATSKPEEFAIRILKHFDLLKYFHSVCGATMDEKRNKKEDVIAFALSSNNINTEHAIMVGDRLYDIDGAHINNIPAIGVLYGFGDLNELSKSGAEYIAESVAQLEEILLKLRR